MSGIRNRIERWFEKLSDTIFDNRYKTLFFVILFVGLLRKIQGPVRQGTDAGDCTESSRCF